MIPDVNVKVIGHFEQPATSYFEAHLPSGEIVLFGKTAETRPMAGEGQPHAWLATEKRDPRGNAMHYGYCFAKNADGSVAEYALDQIDYTSFENEAPTRSVSFVYGVKDDPQFGYVHGIATQQSLRLDEVQMRLEHEAVRRYFFAYEQSETTERTRLQSIEVCASNGECVPPTRFQYSKATWGFDRVNTQMLAPMSSRSSPAFCDFDGDGLSDWLVPDTNELSTPMNPITKWSLSRNTKSGFAAPKVAFLQEWSFVQNPEPVDDSRWIRPELGTVIQYNAEVDQRADILVHDTHNNRKNHIVLESKADGSFQEIDTGIPRPFPAGPTPAHLRGKSGATHLLDADGDAMQDLLSCDDHDATPETAALSTWTLHLWKPGGWEKTGTVVEKLQGYPCELELFTIDTDHNGTTDLVIPGMIEQGGVPSERAPNYFVFRRHTDGTWESHDTNLRVAVPPNRMVWGDFNTDGLPDVMTGDPSGKLVTYKNTGRGFSETPENGLAWDLAVPQTKYLHLAQSGDFDQNGTSDILMPLADADSPTIPHWVILRAMGKNGFTFQRAETGIPFEPTLAHAIELADPRGPRISDVNGDGSPDIAIHLGNELVLFVNRVSDPDVLVALSDGLNEREPGDPEFVPNVSITHGHLTDDLYVAQSDPTNDSVYPRGYAIGPKRVVREYAIKDGHGGQRRFGLQYRDGRFDRRGYGFLGFGERILTDLDTGATTRTFYNNKTFVDIGERGVYPFTGQVTSQWQWAPALTNEPNASRVEMVFADNTLEVVPTNNGKTYFTLATQRRTRRMQGDHTSSDSLAQWVEDVEANENATMLRDSTVNVIEIDEFANVLETIVSTMGVDLTNHVRRTVKNDTTRWILGQLQSQEECSAASGLSQCRTITRTTNAFGEVESESMASDDGIDDTKLTVEHDKRDKYGNITHTTARDAFGNVRESTTVYENEGVFPTKLVNALDQATLVKFDRALGVLKKQTDPNGLTTEWKHDGLGRETLEMRPDGSQTTTTVSRTKIDGKWQLSERTITTGGADDETILDSLSRPIRTFSYGPTVKPNTPRIMQVIEYDRRSGKVAKQSVPTAEDTPDAQLQWDEYEFDALGRTIRHTTPWNAVTTTKYDGSLVDSMDPMLKHTVTELDPLGRPKTITDAANGMTKYAYGPYDTLYTITDPGNEVTKWKRDASGRVKELQEPDRGTTIFKHNGFGDLRESTDALGRVATFDVDELGRVKTRTDKLGTQVLTTTWTWDTAPHGIGQLHMLESPDALETYSYTNRGQLESEMLTVVGDSFAVTLGYNDVGLLKSVDYPQLLGEEPFGVTRDYDERGFVVAVRDKATNVPFWELKEVDKAGRTKEELFGNQTKTVREFYDDKQALKSITTTFGSTLIQDLAYEWDPQLNLKSRADSRQPTNTMERFRYDALNRLTCAYFDLVENAQAACNTSYGYAPNGNLTTKSDVGTLQYNDANHPHAVTNAAGGVYGYDAVGNQITRPGGISITYTHSDLPKTITRGAATTSFKYSGDDQRIRKTSPTMDTIYFGDLFERVRTGNTTEHRYYVHSPERAIAMVTRGGPTPGTNFLHADHLGSIETITNEAGAPVQKRSNDAFGARRNPDWGTPGGVTPSKIRKGFTGHEEDEEFGLVNMKGRLYDPKIGRFTTTDPIIANVYNGQSFGAYSYVLNNPLTLVDPTGFTPQSVIVVPPEVDQIEQTVITKYPDDFVPDPLPEEIRESTNSMRGTTDVGTTGDGGNGLPQGPPNGLDVMGSVLGGAAGAYGNDVLDTARGILLLTVFPPGYFALQGYRFWGSVINGALGGYAQDGVLGAVAGAINSVNPFAHVGIALASTVDAAEKGDYKKAGEQGYQALKGIAGIAATAIGAGIGRGGGGPPRVTSGAQVTEKVIREAMKDAPLKSQQAGGVSLRLVQQYVDRLLNNEVPPAIKVDGKIIVDGNHRYIAGRIVGRDPDIQPWLGGHGPVVNWSEMDISRKW